MFQVSKRSKLEPQAMCMIKIFFLGGGEREGVVDGEGVVVKGA